MKMRMILVLALSQALVAGCATPYEAPSSGKQATLKIQNRTGGQVAPYAFADAATCSGSQTLLKGASRKGLVPGGTLTVAIPADRDFSLQIWADASGGVGEAGYCNIVTTFRPEPGGSYVASAMKDAQACHVQIFREVTSAADESSFVKESSARVRETRATLTAGGVCF